MITQDKFKIKIPLEYIEVNQNHPKWNSSLTVDETESGIKLNTLTFGSQKETRNRYQPHVSKPSVYPGINYIKADYTNPNHQYLEIVATSKALNNPAQLISLNTIEELWDRINATGLIYGYAPQVLPQAQQLAGDINKDLIMEYDPDEYTQLIRRYYVGNRYVQARDYVPNIQLQRNVKGKEFSRTLTGYNKYREAKGEYFDPNTLRWELRLNSFEMLRKYLQLPPGPIMLLKALESTADPISTVIDEIMKDIPLNAALKSINTPELPMTPETRAALFASELTFDHKAIFARLKEIEFNLAPLEAELKGNSHKGEKLKPYKEIRTRWEGFNSDSSHDVELLNELLGKIKSPAINTLINNTLHTYAQIA